jgi:hypothetical protein
VSWQTRNIILYNKLKQCRWLYLFSLQLHIKIIRFIFIKITLIITNKANIHYIYCRIHKRNTILARLLWSWSYGI